MNLYTTIVSENNLAGDAVRDGQDSGIFDKRFSFVYKAFPK
jgi:hypothetical protein